MEPVSVLSALLASRLSSCPPGALGTLALIASPSTPCLEELVAALTPSAAALELYGRPPECYPAGTHTVLCLCVPPLAAPGAGAGAGAGACCAAGSACPGVLVMHCDLAARALPTEARSGPAFLFPPPLHPPPCLQPLAAAVAGAADVRCVLGQDESVPCAHDATLTASPAQQRALQAINLFNVRSEHASQRLPLLLYSPLRVRYRLFAAGPAPLALLPPHAALLLPPPACAAVPTASQGAWCPHFPAGPARGFVNVALALWLEQRKAWNAARCTSLAQRPGAGGPPTALPHSVESYLPALLANATFTLPATAPLAAIVAGLASQWADDSEEAEGGVHEHDTA